MTQPNPSIPAIASISAGIVLGQPRIWLGLEGAAVLFLTTAFYFTTGHPWFLYAVLFFAPDISIVGYLLGPRVGAASYNLLHNYFLPIALLTACHLANVSLAIPLIWNAHVAFDRMIGYGLKYNGGFSLTHLGRREFPTRQLPILAIPPRTPI